jgi:hypothetical protein
MHKISLVTTSTKVNTHINYTLGAITTTAMTPSITVQSTKIVVFLMLSLVLQSVSMLSVDMPSVVAARFAQQTFNN